MLCLAAQCLDLVCCPPARITRAPSRHACSAKILASRRRSRCTVFGPCLLPVGTDHKRSKQAFILLVCSTGPCGARSFWGRHETSVSLAEAYHCRESLGAALASSEAAAAGQAVQHYRGSPNQTRLPQQLSQPHHRPAGLQALQGRRGPAERQTGPPPRRQLWKARETLARSQASHRCSRRVSMGG